MDFCGSITTMWRLFPQRDREMRRRKPRSCTGRRPSAPRRVALPRRPGSHCRDGSWPHVHPTTPQLAPTPPRPHGCVCTVLRMRAESGTVVSGRGAIGARRHTLTSAAGAASTPPPAAIRSPILLSAANPVKSAGAHFDPR